MSEQSANLTVGNLTSQMAQSCPQINCKKGKELEGKIID